jgi:predicted NUDIX family phosphoesterase
VNAQADTEQVLAIPRALALPDGDFRGVRQADEQWLDNLVAASGAFRPRPEMERDPSMKQVIPYLVLRDGPRWFLMRRTRAGGDARLHERASIGVGGHMNPGDTDVRAALRREWAEELDAGFTPDFRFVGLLNDDESDVGSVHLGAVYVAESGGRPVAVREIDKLSGAFATSDEVEVVRDRLETWSALVFDALRAPDPERAT